MRSLVPLIVLLAGSVEQKPIPLDPTTSLERELAAGEQHTYEMVLTEGTFASVSVEQRGIDLKVGVVAPEGLTLVFNGEPRAHGVEEVHIVAAAAGRYELTIAPAAVQAPAGTYGIRVAEMRDASSAERSLDTARRLHQTAVRVLRAGSYEEARRLLEEAIARVERAAGERHPLLINLLSALSDYYEDKEDYPRALASAERAHAISEVHRGTDHPSTIAMTRVLGYLYARVNERAKAEAFARRALEDAKRVLPPDHELIARCLLTVAQIAVAGDSLLPSLHRALAIAERTAGADGALAANILNELGLGYMARKEYDRGEQFLLRALSISQTENGKAIGRVVTLTNLGLIARDRKDYVLAMQYYEGAAAIVERAFGPENPRLAMIINNVANIHRARGDYARSLESHLRVVRIAETTRGPYHPFTMVSLGNIARTYAAQGNIGEAIRYQRRVDTVVERNIDINLAIGSERQKAAYLRFMSERTDRTISLNVALAPQDREATALAALVLLQRKGRVLDALSGSFASLRERATPEERDLLQRFNETTTELARLVLDGPQNTSFADHKQRVAELEQRKERLEEEISRLSAEFRAQTRPVTLAAVQAAIPADAALIELAVYRPFDPQAERNDEAYGAPRYIAYILRREGAIAWHELGDAAEIDQAVGALRHTLRDPFRRDTRAALRALYARTVKPLLPLAGDARRLLVSPDGALNLIPFEALVDDEGRYLVQRYAFTYLTSGRDLLRLQVARESRNPPVTFADPLFGASGSAAADRENGAFFAPLMGTIQEARALKSLFPEMRILSGPHATEDALKKSVAPRILHVATHGFFHDEAVAAPGEARGPGAAGSRAAASSDNPLLRAGLALAGANRREATTEDGILTALEASGLNLWGTKLVVLSACDTGVGEVRKGEGVYGLRRAFVLAGAESLVMSLWPVSDHSTRRLMANYYRNLKRGMGRGDALRAVQRGMLRRTPDLHPFYWANFIQMGAWTPVPDTP